jgi:hypothetical protein
VDVGVAVAITGAMVLAPYAIAKGKTGVRGLLALPRVSGQLPSVA